MPKSDYTQPNTTPSEVRETDAAFTAARKKFATQMDSDLLEQLRAQAKSEGRHIQSILEEAVQAYLKDKRGYVMPPAVKSAYMESLDRYSELYEALAK